MSLGSHPRGMLLPTVDRSSHFSWLIKTVPHRHAQWFVSKVILNLIKVTMEFNHPWTNPFKCSNLSEVALPEFLRVPRHFFPAFIAIKINSYFVLILLLLFLNQCFIKEKELCLLYWSLDPADKHMTHAWRFLFWGDKYLLAMSFSWGSQRYQSTGAQQARIKKRKIWIQ